MKEMHFWRLSGISLACGMLTTMAIKTVTYSHQGNTYSMYTVKYFSVA